MYSIHPTTFSSISATRVTSPHPPLYHPIPVVISRAEGVWVYDPEGNKYLDCLSAYSSQNTGHCHPEIIATLKEQADIVTLTSRAFHNDKMGPFLKMLAEVVGSHINDPHNSGIMSIPTNTGTEAVSTGIKMARAWGYIKKKIPKNQAPLWKATSHYRSNKHFSILYFY